MTGYKSSRDSQARGLKRQLGESLRHCCRRHDAKKLDNLVDRPVLFQHQQERTAPLNDSATNANVAPVRARMTTVPEGTDMWCWSPKTVITVYCWKFESFSNSLRIKKICFYWGKCWIYSECEENYSCAHVKVIKSWYFKYKWIAGEK